MFNFFLKLNKENIRKKIVTQNLNFKKNQENSFFETHIQENQSSNFLGQLLFNKGEVVQNKQLVVLDKETKFLGFLSKD